MHPYCLSERRDILLKLVMQRLPGWFCSLQIEINRNRQNAVEFILLVLKHLRFGMYLIAFNATTILTKGVPSFYFTICCVYTTSNYYATNILP